MSPRQTSKRINQSRRTRKDLLAATVRLLKKGRRPGIEEIAEEALVSRATVYRYFPNVEALYAEAPVDSAVPDPQTLFEGDDSRDPLDRLLRAERAMHDSAYQNESSLRIMMASSLVRGQGETDAKEIPLRQNRRTPLIQAALDPVRDQLDKQTYENLCAAMALIFGTESMIVFRDVLQLDEADARRVKGWALTALVRTAMEESAGKL